MNFHSRQRSGGNPSAELSMHNSATQGFNSNGNLPQKTNNDWASVIQNQSQVYNKMKEDQQLYHQTVKKLYADDLKKAEMEKQMIKKFNQNEDLNTEQIKLQTLAQQNAKLESWQKEEQRRIQNDLALQYTSSKTIEKLEEQQRIQEALKSLERDKIQQRQKKQSYRDELDKMLQLKNQITNATKQVGEDQRKDYIGMMHQRTQQEINNEQQYKNKFVMKDEKMRYRQDQYLEQVQSPQMSKQFEIMNVIEKREQEYNKTQKEKEEMNRQIQQAIQEERQKILERQIREKEMMKQELKYKYNSEVVDRKRQEQEYKFYVDDQRKLAKDQQSHYKQILESQVNIKQALQEERKTLTSKEMQFAKDFIGNGDVKLGMVPGQVSLSKYSMMPKQNGGSDVVASPRILDSPIKNQNLLLDDQQQIMLKKVLPRHFNTNSNSIDAKAINNLMSTPIIKNIPDTAENGKGRHSRLNSSFQGAAQLQLSLNASVNGPLNYNPITNPIPSVNQNPYINRGKMDHVVNLRPRGKIMTTDDTFGRQRLSQSPQQVQSNTFFTMSVGGQGANQGMLQGMLGQQMTHPNTVTQNFNSSNAQYNRLKLSAVAQDSKILNLQKERPLVQNGILQSSGSKAKYSQGNSQMGPSAMEQINSIEQQQQQQQQNNQIEEQNQKNSSHNNTNGTKSTSALGSMANLISKEAALTQAAANSQLMFVRGSIGGGSQQPSNTVTIQNSSNSNRGASGGMVNISMNSQVAQAQFKNSKTQLYEKMMFQTEKKNMYIQNGQGGLFPRISNLRNEVTVLFKNSGGSQNGPTNANAPGGKVQASGQREAGYLLSQVDGQGINRVIIDKGGLNYQYNQTMIGNNNRTGLTNLADDLVQNASNSTVKASKMRKRLKSNTHNNFAELETDMYPPQIGPPNAEDDSFNQEPQPLQNRQFYSEKYQSAKQALLEQKRMIKDDMSLGGYSRKGVSSSEDQHHHQPSAMTPQIMSSHSNKRQYSQQQKVKGISQAFINQQQFFSRRTGSQKEGQALNIPQPQHQFFHEGQNSFEDTMMSSPTNEQIMERKQYEGGHQDGFEMKRVVVFDQNQSNYSTQQQENNSLENSPGKKTQDQAQQQTDQPKIPVICGFHKRILLLTSQVGLGSQGPGGGINPQALQRRIRNKNPNCNHNNNFVFYQPSYNNVKYDDSYKKKEEVLRKVFFKECAKEEEKRNSNNNNPSQPTQAQTKDPIQYLKVIEDFLSQTLFAEYETQYLNKGHHHSLQAPNLFTELGLDQTVVAHKAFMLALIKAGKIVNENIFKVLHEFKTCCKDYDNECIYCKYSLYALRESQKVTNMSNVIPQSAELQMNIEQAQHVYQESSDPKIENLVRMFSSQLFKRSFINTSLMIIQKKMNDKLLKKAKSAQNNGEKQGEPQAKNIIPLSEKKKKEGVPRKITAGNNISMNAGQVSTLENLANQMQKLAKNLANPKDKEKYLELKEKYYKEFLLRINLSNQITISFPKQSLPPYKYYIGKGNNSILVKNCLKSRFWWSVGDFEEWDEYNFMWTQWKSNKILSVIKTHADALQLQNTDARSGLTSAGGESMLSTQITVTDKDSNSSVEALLATPTKRKRASTLPQNQQNLLKKVSAVSSSIQNSANKNLAKISKEESAKVEDKKEQTSHVIITYNHMENNFHLSNKKALYYNMKIYYESIGTDWWTVLPLTFHIKEGVNDKEFTKFLEVFKGESTQYGNMECLGKQIWIVKPGENTNRGCGIQVCRELPQIKEIIQNTTVNGQKRSYIIQKYIEKPLLYKNRKFDIRCYALITSVNGNLQGYWYNEGYLRTSSKDFNLKNVTNRLIHLTNDAVQKKSDDYGKFETGNKLSYVEFQKYMDNQDIKCNFVKEIVPQLKKIVTDTIKAVSRKLDPNRRHCTFEIFGYDFMIDEDLKPWLIEVNTNPCLELSSPLLGRLIPAMVENAVKIAIDPLFPPPPWPNSKKHTIPDCIENKFELVFNELTDAAELKNLPIDDTMNGIIEEEEMEDEGSEDEEEENN